MMELTVFIFVFLFAIGIIMQIFIADIELHEIVPDIIPSEIGEDEMSPEVRDLRITSNPLNKLVAPTCKVSESTDIFQDILRKKVMKDVMDTRPSVQVARGMSMRFRARSAFERKPNSVHSSLPTRKRSAISSRADSKCVCVHVCVHLCVCACACVHACMYVCLCVRAHVSVWCVCALTVYLSPNNPPFGDI